MAFHLFHVEEVYSNADGTIQFIELLGEATGQNVFAGHTITATQGATTNSFTFATNLPVGSTLNASVLIGTTGYAAFALANGLPAPNYTVPNGFLFTTGNVSVNFAEGTYVTGSIALPRDGVLSWNQTGSNDSTTFQFLTNSPKNFAGATGTIGNSPPVVANAIPDQVFGNDPDFDFQFAANVFTDPGDTLTYEAFLNDDDPLPAWLTFTSGTRTFSGTPAPEDAGPYTIRVVATDEEDAEEDDVFVLTVLSGEIVNGTAAGESLPGTAGTDSINGLGGDDTLDGGADNDTMVGGAGNDSLDGGTGNDSMVGGTENDTYVVDSLLDSVTEASGQGTDHVQSSLTITLATNVENLTLTGGENINGTGNASNNSITGNSGDNSLNGGGGADSMSGGLGNDTYTTDGGDTITEDADAGLDTVLSSVSNSLGANQEILVLSGVALNGTGNSGANTITGNANDNFLNGAGGADSMEGGAGNDVFMVDDIGDVATDSGGTDRVESSVSFTIATGIENLTLLESAAIDGTGNAGANIVRGNSAANELSGDAGADTLLGLGGDDSLEGSTDNDRLDGGSGNDTLNGGAGVDRLDGGVGADVFIFTHEAAGDSLREFHSGEDEIQLDNDIFAGIASGALAAEDIQVGLRSAISATSGGGDLLKFATDTGELFYDSDGAGALEMQLILAIVSCSASGTTLDFGAAQDIFII